MPILALELSRFTGVLLDWGLTTNGGAGSKYAGARSPGITDNAKTGVIGDDHRLGEADKEAVFDNAGYAV